MRQKARGKAIPNSTPGRDPESRNHKPATFKYFLSVSYRFPRLKGVKEESDPAKTEGFDDPALLPGGTDDLADNPSESRPPEGDPGAEEREDYQDPLYSPSGSEVEEEQEEEEEEDCKKVRAAKVKEEYPWETTRCEYEAPSDFARLVFCVPLHSNNSAHVMEALQQVYIELRSLNLPVLRFHTDRGREFCNSGVRAWFHHRGVRTTTREADAPQQNGAAEQAVRWLKARARTLLRQAGAGSELWPCAMATAAMSPSVNDGHVVLRNDGKGNGFVQTLHVRTKLFTPEPPPLEFVGDSVEPEHPPPRLRVRGKRALEELVGEDEVPPPLPPPAEAPRPEGFVLHSEEEEPPRIARVSLQVLEQTARELVEEDWDLDEALWVLAIVCKVEPQLQLKVGLYRHGGVVGVLGGTSQRPWLTELMVQVLSAVAPGAEYTSLWLSNSTVQPVHVDSQNLQGSTNVVLPVKLPRVGGELWVELQPGDVPSSVVEERVDGKGHRFLGVTHQLQKGKPFFLDPRRRHATAPWEGERVVLVAYTVNTLGTVPESDLQALESLGFPLPGSTRLPLTQQQDVRRLDAFDCFEEEPLREAQECVERVVGGDLLRWGLERDSEGRSGNCETRGFVEPETQASPASSVARASTSHTPGPRAS